ncbi:alpha-(1-_3)-arabinofuranosyltransferase [soil metagenome]
MAATSRLRLIGYAVIITALAFSQSTGRIVADTKLDLVAAPWRFLGLSTQLWDPGQAFGQIRFQAYGYLWPMGPFFGVGDLLGLPEWVIQRLWWALLLNVAFFGVLYVLRALPVGTGWTQVAAAASFVLSLRFSTILGANSVELWPTAVAPWVLLALIHGSRRGSVVRAGAVAALAVACAGGVNATATAAVLPIGVIWIFTRSPGPRRLRLLCWWGGFTVLACLWWLLPLALLGRYSPPILGYMESSAITQSTTGLTDTLLGTSDWVAYASGAAYPAGVQLLTTPFVLLDAAVVAAVGLLGVCLAGPHRRFATWSVLVGVALVGFGYAGSVSGFWADQRQDGLDGALAALRNSHKFDGTLRLGLAIGAAHGLAVIAGAVRSDLRVRRIVTATSAIVLCGLTLPWLTNTVAPPGGFKESPAYWNEAVAYLDSRAEDGIALVVPASPFGDYAWGSTHDDVIQPVATSSWGSRNVLPLTQPGLVVLLDRITEIVESGRPDPELVDLLRQAGVGLLVVRNDLNRLVTGAPDPAYLHAALENVPGLVPLADFGPSVGEPPVLLSDEVGRVVRAGGLTGSFPSVEVLRVLDGAADASIVPVDLLVAGAPGAGVAVTTMDPQTSDVGGLHVVLTDTLRRREMAFQGVRLSSGATEPAGSAPRQDRAETFHRLGPDQERWQVVETVRGATSVTASSSGAYVDAGLPLDRGTAPMAAFDADPVTAWRTPERTAPDGQWIQVDLDGPHDVASVSLRIAPGSALVGRIRIQAGGETAEFEAPLPGEEVTWPIDLPDVDSLRVTAVGGPPQGSWGLAELALDGVEVQRYLALPEPPAGAQVDRIELARDREPLRCPLVADVVACDPLRAWSGEDGDTLARTFSLRGAASYELSGTASLRRSSAVATAVLESAGLAIRGRSTNVVDVAESRIALADGDPATYWRSSEDHPRITVLFDAPRRVDTVTLAAIDSAAISTASRVRLVSGSRRALLTPTTDGTVHLPSWRVQRLTITIVDVQEAFDETGVPLPVGASDILLNGLPLVEEPIVSACGEGPEVVVGGTVLDTAVTMDLAEALRGGTVELRICADRLVLPDGETDVVAAPTDRWRVDTLQFGRTGTPPISAVTVPVVRASDGMPESVSLPASESARVLALPQNFNDGWRARIGDQTLTPTRVAGWQQAWVVPAGVEVTVRFDYPPDATFRIALGVGALGLLAVLAVALRRRGSTSSDLPSLTDGVGGWTTPVAAAALLGWLGGWPGLVLGIGAFALLRWSRLDSAGAVRRLPSSAAGVVAGTAFGVGAALRIWPQESLPEGLSQGAALVSLCVVAGSLVAGSLRASRPTSLRLRNGFSTKR